MLEAIEKSIPTRADLTRERILEAAEVVFARHGLNGTRVREIADAAGVNVATLYIYFPSKSDLHEAVLERGVRPLIDLMTEFSAGPGDTEATAQLFDAVMRHLGTRPNLSRLIYLEAISEGRYLPKIVDRWLRPLLESGVNQVREHPVSTPWEKEQIPLIMAVFMHLSFGHFALAPLFREIFGRDLTSNEWVERQIGFIGTLVRQMFRQPG